MSILITVSTSTGCAERKRIPFGERSSHIAVYARWLWPSLKKDHAGTVLDALDRAFAKRLSNAHRVAG